jgi:hypothetical protein
MHDIAVERCCSRHVFAHSCDRSCSRRSVVQPLRKGPRRACNSPCLRRWPPRSGGPFTPPRSWLSGVAANLGLALVWLLVQPLHPRHHHDWVILIGTYFSSFFWRQVPRATGPILGRESRSFIHIGIAAAIWAIATALAMLFFSGRGLRIAETRPQTERPGANIV